MSQTARPRKEAQPRLDLLEDRSLTAIIGISAHAKPQKLVPNGKYVPVEVWGEVSNTRTDHPPQVTFQVIDQYRQTEPAGTVKLVQKKPGTYSFDFTIHLQARHSATFQSARLYSITLGAQDAENGAGSTVPVIVPAYYKPSPIHTQARARKHG